MYLQHAVGIRGRGQGQGRGTRYSGRHTSVIRTEDVLPAPAPSQQLSDCIDEQDLELATLASSAVAIEKVEYVASYNWLDRTTPSILSPGIPPKWLPPGRQVTLQEDKGEYYRDPNAARFPRHPVKPAIAATFQTNSTYDAASIDVFACGNTLGSLLSFVSGEKRTFRFGVEVLGKTVFLVRQNNTPDQLLENVVGYGHAFADASTTWDSAVRGSVSHQRIISYDFAGLKCMVRSECDGYLPGKLSLSHAKTPGHVEHSGPNHNDDDDGGNSGNSGNSDNNPHDGANAKTASEAFQDLRMIPQLAERQKSRLRIDHPKSLTLSASLLEIPQEAIFDLKTRSIRGMHDIKVEQFLPRLWANQTPTLILAYHSSGIFKEENIQIHDMREKVQRWESTHQKELGRLAAVLNMLRDLVRSEPYGGKLEVRREGTGNLDIWTAPPGWHALPAKWSKRWTNTAAASEGDDDGESTDADADADADEDKDEDKDEDQDEDEYEPRP